MIQGHEIMPVSSAINSKWYGNIRENSFSSALNAGNPHLLLTLDTLEMPYRTNCWTEGTGLASRTSHVSSTPFQEWTGIFADLSFHLSKSEALTEADKIILVIKAVGEGRMDAEMWRVINVNNSEWVRQSKPVCYYLFSLKLVDVQSESLLSKSKCYQKSPLLQAGLSLPFRCPPKAWGGSSQQWPWGHGGIERCRERRAEEGCVLYNL